VLLAPSFNRLPVPIDKFEKFVGNNVAYLRSVETGQDGSFLLCPLAMQIGMLRGQWPLGSSELDFTQLENGY